MLNSVPMEYFQSQDCESRSEADTTIKKYHSILPDLATGWRPKNARIAAPIFITYEDELNDYALQTGLNSLNKLVYIGILVSMQVLVMITLTNFTPLLTIATM